MKRHRYHFTIQTTYPTINGTAVSRLATSEAEAQASILRVVHEAAPDATLRPARKCLEDKSHLKD